MIVSAEQEMATIQSILLSMDVPSEEALVQAQMLLEADLRGHPSHGIQRLAVIVERIRKGFAVPGAAVQDDWRSDSVLLVDGQRGLGPVVALHALELIAERAATTGVAVAAVRNNNHLGMLALYAEEAARRARIGIILTTSEALVHPWGGRMAMIGTNPIAVGVPAHPHPFVLDMATGIVSMGEVLEYGYRGEALPEGWALDSRGLPTTDPKKAAAGSLAPFGGAKGYGLGIAFELLVSSLTCSAVGTAIKGTLDTLHVCNKGDVLICFDPVVLGALDFAAGVSRYLEALHQSPTADGHDRVRVPGDRSRELRARRLAEGIPLADHVWQQVEQLRIQFAGAEV